MRDKFDRRPIRAAFRELERYGILCEGGRWVCCQSCGHHDLRQRWEAAGEDEKPLGYCFWHAQDEESLVATGKTMLAFNAFDSSDSMFVGRIVVGVLKKHGVKTQWNGDRRKRIEFTLPKRGGSK